MVLVMLVIVSLNSETWFVWPLQYLKAWSLRLVLELQDQVINFHLCLAHMNKYVG